ncbi:hypothetical protein TRVL_06690 [Trypanosoma vivax]|nr:hypothetical protein TRVL_06690 [Trypanosoma vivax]
MQTHSTRQCKDGDREFEYENMRDRPQCMDTSSRSARLVQGKLIIHVPCKCTSPSGEGMCSLMRDSSRNSRVLGTASPHSKSFRYVRFIFISFGVIKYNSCVVCLQIDECIIIEIMTACIQRLKRINEDCAWSAWVKILLTNTISCWHGHKHECAFPLP